MKPDQLNLKEDKVGNNLELKGPGKYILNRTHLAQTLRSKISKWILIKLKFLHCKGYYYLDKEEAYRMGKDINQLHI